MNRRLGQTILGLIWILVGCLELFPSTAHAFAGMVRQQAEGQPPWLHNLLIWGADLLQPHGVIWNNLLGAVELAIGFGILLAAGNLLRLALTGSILLSLAIWIWGEGFGGAFTSTPTDIGAMPLYILAALLVWPPREPARRAAREPTPAGIGEPTGDD